MERESSRPDFLILAYPVITMEDPYVHTGSRTYLLGDAPTQAEVDAMSPELHVTAQTPPAFLFSTTDDHTVPMMNSVMFYEALVKAGVPAEMHLFQHGGHGSGLGVGNRAVERVAGAADQVDAGAGVRGGVEAKELEVMGRTVRAIAVWRMNCILRLAVIAQRYKEKAREMGRPSTASGASVRQTRS